jgi:hypothetical protein
MGIVWIDMQIRDERVYAWIEKQGQTVKVSGDDVASEFKCHPNTGRAILKRLRQAGLLEVFSRSYRGGFVYEVKRA